MLTQSILQRVAIRELSGICWYPVESMIMTIMNQGGTADKIYSPLTERIFLSGAFFILNVLTENKRQKKNRRR